MLNKPAAKSEAHKETVSQFNTGIIALDLTKGLLKFSASVCFYSMCDINFVTTQLREGSNALLQTVYSGRALNACVN